MAASRLAEKADDIGRCGGSASGGSRFQNALGGGVPIQGS